MSHEVAEAGVDVPVRVPDHVVFRSFAHETVVLNLQTGRYHGLNPTAGAMLSALQTAGSVRAALAPLRESFPSAGDRLESDLLSFCENASQRGLIEINR